MAGRIKGAQPPRPGPRVEIVRITTAEVQKFLVLGTAVFGQLVHWYGGRSHECKSDSGACENCKRGWPVKWKGYLHSIRQADNKECFVELTPSAVHSLEALFPEGELYRGKILNFSKTKGGAKGRFIITCSSPFAVSAKLPAESDPLPVLRYLWNCKNTSANLPNETV